MPVALNAGLFWPRRKLAKYRGTVTIQFLKPIAPGLEKREFLPCSRSEIEIRLMRTLKDALDPQHILNPGKVF